MQQPLKLGMIGLDTSHVTAFAAILNDPGHSHHVPGGKIAVAYPGVPSADFALSYGRVQQYTDELSEHYQVAIVDSAEAVAEQCDAVLLESVDGRVHLELFKAIAPYGKPVFIDKPFTTSGAEAKEIFDIAARYQVPVMSCSSLRYSEGLTENLLSAQDSTIIGADCHGPMSLEPTQPGFFWYGIHSVEMLYRILGRGCLSVSVTTNDDYDVITGVWKDGRIGVVRGNRKGNYQFGALIHRVEGTSYVDASADAKPAYSGMLERVIRMFQSGKADIDTEETLEIIHFLESANNSRVSGTTEILP
ncbi:Gfo/Idh/MocA family protein [Paenibacillus sp. GCM10027626]|uniref:Gfo/Idh/MocA family protein n=1 Tax=Paenibacillus sp. GCM10027626 TaxID=3273411 RepID=UPI0036398BE1